MRIKPEHLQAIAHGYERAKLMYPPFAYVKAVLDKECPGRDAARIYRWEVLYEIAKEGTLLHEIYEYANDEHIDTALRHAISLK